MRSPPIAFIVMLAAASCSDGGGGAGTAGSDTARPAQVPSGSGGTRAAPSASASSAPWEATVFCGQICKRSADCGLEKVKNLAKSGDATDKEALAKAEGERDGVERTCLDECTKSPPPGPADETVVKAKACLDQKTCAEYDTCLKAAAPQK